MTGRLRGARELGGVGLLLAAIGAAVYEPHAIHGGFLSDAWANLARYEFAPGSGPLDTLSYFLEAPNISVRPLQAVYLLILYEAFGSHMGFWLTWQVATNVLMVLLLYALLRRLSLAGFDAACVAVLVLIFPAASSVRFWTPTIWAPLSISMILLGFMLALAAFQTEERRKSLLLHAVSLSLFVASLLLYEVTLLIMLASVLLYRLRVPWATAARRWAVDCAVLIPILVTVTLSSSGHAETTEGLWRHGVAIFEQAWMLLATVVLPLRSAHWYILLLLALIPAASFLVYRRLPASSPVRPELRQWLVAMAGGFVVVALGYAIFVPGTDYYNPMGFGIADRVNAVPSIGWVVVLYAGAMLVGTLAFRGLSRARLLSSGLAAVACALIAIGWLKTLANYSDAYVHAYSEDTRVLATIQTALPDPPPRSTIWTFGQPVEIVPGVPVFGNTWDMTSSVRLTYNDPTLTSYVAYPGTTFACRKQMVVPRGVYVGVPGPDSGSPYGRTYFIDTTVGHVQSIRSPAQCRRASASFPRSPALPDDAAG
jgi:hypothetical protein